MRIVLAALAMVALPANAADFEFSIPSNTQIVFTPVACPEKAQCNVFHVRYVTHDGIVEFSRDIPSAWMASNTSIEVRTPKGTVRIWSER